jgi:hypothetical protein
MAIVLPSTCITRCQHYIKTAADMACLPLACVLLLLLSCKADHAFQPNYYSPHCSDGKTDINIVAVLQVRLENAAAAAAALHSVGIYAGSTTGISVVVVLQAWLELQKQQQQVATPAATQAAAAAAAAAVHSINDMQAARSTSTQQ